MLLLAFEVGEPFWIFGSCGVEERRDGEVAFKEIYNTNKLPVSRM
jgi:hypothetical protein